MLLGRRVPLRGRSEMVYFDFVNELTRLLGTERNLSINSGTIIQFSILVSGITTNGAYIHIHRCGFFRSTQKKIFFGWWERRQKN
jgi:hypothetical protein